MSQDGKGGAEVWLDVKIAYSTHLKAKPRHGCLPMCEVLISDSTQRWGCGSQPPVHEGGWGQKSGVQYLVGKHVGFFGGKKLRVMVPEPRLRRG